MDGRSRFKPAAVSCFFVLIFVVLLMRTLGVYPVVFGDEYTYSSLSRLLPFSASYIPGYLYLGVYRLTSMCGDGFLDCARVLNVMFFMAAAPFIYLVARRACTQNVSLWVTALAMIAPINSFTIYFMPEPLYFLSFWICLWYFLSLSVTSSLGNWAIFGILLGLSALVKPHAMFIVPALAATTVYMQFGRGDKWVKASASKVFIFVAGMFATKFLISYLLAGQNGLTLLGNFYTSTLTTNASNLDRYFAIFLATPKIAAGHVLAICILFGLPVVVLITQFCDSSTKETYTDQKKLAFLTLVLLVNLIGIVALFSASVMGSNEIETAVRLHMRYYDFIFPLFYIAAGARAYADGAVNRISIWAVSLPVLAVMAYATVNRLAPFTPYMVDSPELRGLSFNTNAFYILSALSIASLLVWTFSRVAGVWAFLIVFMPLAALTSSVYINHEVRQRMVMDDYDKAGILAKQYLSKDDLSKLAIVGENPSGALRALFYVDDARASRIFPAEGRRFGITDVPEDKEWVLVVGNVQFDESGFEVQRFNGFLLAHKNVGLHVSFASTSWPAAVQRVYGLGAPEPWGAWSVDEVVGIEFSRPIPRDVTLKLSARAFGPNIGAPVKLEVGGRIHDVVLEAVDSDITIELKGLVNVTELKFRVPHPVSPKELGLSVDTRRLGVGFVDLTLIPRP